MAEARNGESQNLVDERAPGCDNPNDLCRHALQEIIMAAKIVVGLVVIVVLAVLGTAGMMYVNDSLAVPTFDERQTPTQSQSSSCASSRDDDPPACCRQPILEPISSGSRPGQQQATSSVDSAEK